MHTNLHVVPVSIYTCIHVQVIPYSLKFSRIKYFAGWLNSAQKQIFADKIFVVKRESRQVHSYVQQVLNFFAG